MNKEENKSPVNRIVGQMIADYGNERHVGLKVAAYLIFFLAITFIHSQITDSTLYPISGVLSQTQALASILIVLTAGKRGFQAVVFAGLIQIIMAVLHVFRTQNQMAIPGALVPAVMILILFIVVLYSRRLMDELHATSVQKEELQRLNTELLSREHDASAQNEQLSEFNRTMKENEEKLYHLVHYDSLTELPNRIKIADRIALLINLLSQKRLGFALLMLDLDHFKQINDSVGHQVGDAILKSVAERLRRIAHPDDLVGRFGGDEFVVIVQRQMKEEELLVYAEAIRMSLTKGMSVEEKDYNISVSSGIAIYPTDGSTAADLMKNAETAMYKAKEGGRNGVRFFRKDMMDDIMMKAQYESELRMSIQNNEIYLVFQPQYHARTKKLRGFETLARWVNVKLGAVSPNQFIPIAEQAGIMVPMGEWILEKACEKLNALIELYGDELVMSVNISAVQIMSPTFLSTVRKIIRKTGCNPHNLEFEVTESVMISSVDHVITILRELNRMGIRIALDDFGTGYSSLSYLQVLPIDTLKIDKSFVDNMVQESVKRLMVGSIISLVHQMDMEVVAEGVDSDSQLDCLHEFNCDYIQGFIWGKPLSENDARDLLLREKK
ncbi:MAG: EAL domain-containing protein [Clostridiaceae bacterium]|jgi:diguanylate cyclase (GGDEF)-like protein|nr:EAL domain-containing protein [Oscillospiraceae bacterium]NLO61960.1 EAL domain-containing protein [Clostridiaceae bacterium]